MADIFGNTVSYGGGFRKSGNTSTFSLSATGSGKLSLVQDAQLQYQQNVQPLYEVGSANVYFSQTAASGTITINRVISNKSGASGGSTWSSMTVCKPGTIRIASSSGGGQCLQSSIKYTLNHCIPQQVSWSLQAQNAYIMEGVTIMFASLDA